MLKKETVMRTCGKKLGVITKYDRGKSGLGSHFGVDRDGGHHGGGCV